MFQDLRGNRGICVSGQDARCDEVESDTGYGERLTRFRDGFVPGAAQFLPIGNCGTPLMLGILIPVPTLCCSWSAASCGLYVAG